MKKRLFTILLNLTGLFFISEVSAQTVPNGDFENWTQEPTYLVPDVAPPCHAFTSSNLKSYPDANVLTMSKIAHGGGSAMRVETKTIMSGGQLDTITGFAIWGDNPNGGGGGGPLIFTGGFPFTDQNVTGFKVDLRYNVNVSDYGLILIQFKKNGVPIGGGNAPAYQPGLYAFLLTGNQSTFSTMTFSFSPALPVVPDSCVIGFTSSNPGGSTQYPGNFVEVDNIIFTGTSQQVPDGNLDSWVNSPPTEILTGWNFEDNTINYKTTDKYSGNFAIALSVFDRGGGGPNNNEVTRAFIGTVYHDTSNIYTPGMAVTGNPQSIGFYYKYSTPGLDTGSVYVRLTKWNGTSRDDVGGTYMSLSPQANYSYTFSLMQYQNGLTADSAFIEFDASKRWPGSVAGSLLIVDDVRLNYCNEALSISGINSVCANATGLMYTVHGTPFSTYAWTVPTGAAITAGGTTDTITVDFGTNTGLVSVIKSYADGCPDDTTDLSVAIQGTASAFAGNDTSICANGSVILNAAVTGASGGYWTGSSGAFSTANTSLMTVYFPSPAEITAGSVTLTLNTTGNGGCSPASDDIVITITPAPTANAGANQIVCDNDSIALNGSVTLASGGMWTSSGNGIFIPDNVTLTSSYMPSNGDKINGNVTLTLTTTGGSCPPVSDDIVVGFIKAPIVYAGDDQTICTITAPLNGSVTNATGGTWTTSGTGTFAPNANTLTATYSFSAQDLTVGSVTITLHSTGNNAPCTSDSSQLILTYSTCTGIYSGTVKDDMKIYPSPASSIVNIEMKQGINITEVTVLNSMSQDVHAHVMEISGNTASIDMSALNAGMYFIRVSDGQSVLLKKVVKE